ncbi:hypothetical protein B296_00016243 [Ensete ventricosum]|uniref:Uncharacterized protein n=1 Tax=Ensete ventricosum TaxID=4639 RepID=A0A427ABL7_ENSVE|nr:hypothetical protein B296_00016243 [Ensete ventricosum]
MARRYPPPVETLPNNRVKRKPQPRFQSINIDVEPFETRVVRALSKPKGVQDTTYCLLGSLVEHSCNNPKFLAFGYLNEKPIDIGLMKFLKSEVKSTEVETSPVVTRVHQTPHMQSPRRFIEGIRKLARNAKRDSRKEDRRTCRKIVGVCQSIRDDSQQVSAGKSPRRRLDRSYHRLRATAND